MPSIERTFGGPVNSLIGYARSATLRGTRILVAAPAAGPEDEAWFREQAPMVELYSFPSIGSGPSAISLALIAWLWRRRSEADVWHVHGLLNPVSSSALRLAPYARVPVALRPFGTMSLYTAESGRVRLKRIYTRWVDRRGVMSAGAVHVTSAGERSDAIRYAAELEDRIFVIPPPALITDSGDAAHHGDDQPACLFLSRLNPKKNVESLIDAWALVLTSVPRARLIIAGSGEANYVEALRARARDLGDRVEFVGFVAGAEKMRLLRDANAFVLPSFHENFGVAVVEAMGSGIPVVVTSAVDTADVVAANALGVVVDPTADAIAAGIVHVLTDSPLRERCRTRGPALMQSLYSYAATGDRLMHMYERAIANSIYHRNDS